MSSVGEAMTRYQRERKRFAEFRSSRLNDDEALGLRAHRAVHGHFPETISQQMPILLE
jgi:hypothetical protein